MTENMVSFLMMVQEALHELAQTGDKATYDKLQVFIAEKHLEGIDLPDIVTKKLL